MKRSTIFKFDNCGPPNPSAGFTLLEILVAMSIMACVLVAVYKMHMQTISMSNRIRFTSVSPFLAQSKLSEVETKSADELQDDAGDFGDEFQGYRWQVSVEEVESNLLGGVREDLKKIDITVSFNEDENTYTLRTYRLVR